MKIAFFSKHLPSDEPNGVSVQVHRLAQALAFLGHSVTVHTFSPPVNGAKYGCVTLKQRPLPYILRKFAPALSFRKINTSQFDVVHFHGDDYLCAGSEGRVRTFYGSALEEALHARSMGRRLYQTAFYCFEWISCLKKGELVAISPFTKRCLPLVRHFIPCCVPTDMYCPSGDKSAKPSILFLGDFNSRKRGSVLIKAFTESVLPVFPECELTVVGPAPCAGRNVVYCGRLDELRLIEAYRRSWILCMPSSYEGFGVPMIEAMACGTPVLATHNPGSDALIRHDENGWLCYTSNLGASLVHLLSYEEKRRSLAAAGLRLAANYDSKAIARQYEQLYRKIVDRKQNHRPKNIDSRK